MHVAHALLQRGGCRALVFGADAVAEVVDAEREKAEEELLDRAGVEMARLPWRCPAFTSATREPSAPPLPASSSRCVFSSGTREMLLNTFASNLFQLPIEGPPIVLSPCLDVRKVYTRRGKRLHGRTTGASRPRGSAAEPRPRGLREGRYAWMASRIDWVSAEVTACMSCTTASTSCWAWLKISLVWSSSSCSLVASAS